MATNIQETLFHAGAIPWPVVIQTTLLLTLGYTIYGAIWRLYLSPVAHVPGPWFAKLTYWNELYYDVIVGGQYTWQIAKYHEKYGPIIRISPDEVHINDPNFIDEVYVGHSKRKSNKRGWSVRVAGLPFTTVFTTLDHDMHRRRREPWNPYFSKMSVTRSSTHIASLVGKLCDKLAAAEHPVSMAHAFSCLTIDVISEFTFPEGYDYLSRPGFSPETHDAYVNLARLTHSFKHIKGFAVIMQNCLPMWLAKYIDEGVYAILKNEEDLREQVRGTLKRRKGNSKELENKEKMMGRPSLIDALLDSKLPASDKTVNALTSNAVVSIGAGTLTTGHLLKTATFHVLANPPIHARLLADLETVMPDPMQLPPIRELERLDYLTAVMNESLRVMKVPPQRNPRIFPDTDIYYNTSVKLPAGTPISMTGCLLHDLPEICPDPYTFNPDRWLPLNTNGQQLSKYFMPFGRGSRSCVGMELGKAEFVLAMAGVFRRFGRSMKLTADTNRERDVDIVSDYFFSLPSSENNGVLVDFGGQV